MAKGSRAKNLKAKDVSSKQASRVKGGGTYDATLTKSTSISQPVLKTPILK